MENQSESIQQLLMRLELLSKKQDQFAEEINDLRFRIKMLKASTSKDEVEEIVEKKKPIVVSEATSYVSEKVIIPPASKPKIEQEKPKYSATNTSKPFQKKSDLEKFIGENLLNKIGIIITIMGVASGVKYSIEHELITPLTRIILGYLSGIALLGFGIKLREKYENYSAVLVSGAIAILYFITYAAHGFYGLIPQTPAFILMVIFTVFGVVSAIRYDRQVIAHIGLVGAYAVPFLLSNDSGNATVLFSYIAIINIGILTISFKKYWKPLLGSSFGLTWLIYVVWFASDYTTTAHFGLALVFLSVFFIIFYITVLAYKLIKKEVYTAIDIILLLFNTFFFYGLGYLILNGHEIGEQFLGIFTLINALLHLIVSYVLFTRKESDRNLLYLVFGLVLTFITITIPVQLDGNWVTMLWAFEAALLFWIGRTKSIAIYEKLSYPVLFLAFFSLVHDWISLYPGHYSSELKANITPIINMNFLGSILFIVAIGYITYLYYRKEYKSPLKLSKTISQFLSIVIPGILLFSIYYAFKVEIESYWNQLFIQSKPTVVTNDSYNIQRGNYNLLEFKSIWIINYSVLFLCLLSFVNMKKIKNALLGYINLGLNVFMILVFLISGLFALSELRDAYIQQVAGQQYEVGLFYIYIRYISYLFITLILGVCYKYIRQEFIKRDFKIIFDGILHITILCIWSSELIHWLDMASNAESDKLGLSILWGVYALFVIILGIWKQKQYLRIGAIVVFGITLVKLFFYDISHLTTIAKTIVFVSLGVLLLIISFLYNKYKNNIFDDASNEI
jgi:uncharacterized membrane protein